MTYDYKRHGTTSIRSREAGCCPERDRPGANEGHRWQKVPARLKPYRGPPIMLRSAATAQVRLIL